MRTPSQRPTKDGGYLHDTAGRVAPTIAPKAAPALSRPELELMARQFESSVNPARLESFAADMGLSVASLQRLRIGYSHDKRAWAFPMVNGAGSVVGIRLRTETGKKFSVTGGHEGLFIPRDFGDGQLCICEGPTSAAALLDLGFNVAGRPSCSGSLPVMLDFLKRVGRRDVVVFGDRDCDKFRPDGSAFRPGQDGAEKLAGEIRAACRSVKVVIPPRHKDCRDWLKAGTTPAVVAAIIRAARYVVQV